jgi:hypothetical protein
VQPKTLTKLLGFLAFLALVAAATVAAWDYEPTSQGNRGQGLERIWHGVLALVGQEQNATSGMIWIGRALAVLALALIAVYVVRRVRGSEPTNEHAAAPQQHAPQHQQPQVQWATGGPQPAPVQQPSWGAVTSGPTPLPVVPPPAEKEPDPTATRQVIIPPLPPNWGRN